MAPLEHARLPVTFTSSMHENGGSDARLDHIDLENDCFRANAAGCRAILMFSLLYPRTYDRAPIVLVSL